jgi:uncharacterized protein YraI
MRMRSLVAFAAFCVTLVLPGVAAAQSIAYASPDGYSNLRSGPGTNYNIIARIYPGSSVDVLGCLDTRAWCDVVVQDIRGWIYASRLEFVYGGRRVLVPDYYSYFDAPVVYFNFGDDDRYRYRHRHRNRHRDDDKEIFGHPGGGGPGPQYISPPDTGGQVVRKRRFGHPGGGGPGPESIGPDAAGTPVEGTTRVGPCSSGDPNCIEAPQ